MIAPTFKSYRVRFCEWQSFGAYIVARSPEAAIAIAQELRNEEGEFAFEEIDGGTEGWEAEAEHPFADHARILDEACTCLRLAGQIGAADDAARIIAELTALRSHITG